MDDPRFAELISKIAHELRSPLTSVKGFSSTLISRWERFTDQQRFDMIQAISSDADRMSRIVTDVLDLARLESNTLNLHLKVTRIAEVVDAVRGELERLPGAERIEVDVADEMSVVADRRRLHRVLFNLLENAIKFSKDGPISVTATDGGEVVVIAVQDSGVGIPEHRISTVFEGPGPAGQSATPKGAGLGLYLSKRLVESHGGTMVVESQEGRGAVFFVELPVRTDVG